MEGREMRTRKSYFGMKNNGTRKAMSKRLLSLMVVTLLTVGSASAQIFLDDETLTNRGWLGDMDDLGNIIPFHEVEWDQAEGYVPIGSGVMLLTVLGGAYLIGKKRREED
jgi:hypothetical protein